MNALRLALRIPAAGLWTLAATLLFLLLAPVALALGSLAAWRARVQSHWAAGLLWILGADVAVDGTPPRGSFLLVANHLSYVDILVLASRLRCRFVSKAEVRGWPVLGPLSRLAGTLFVDRTRRRDVVRVAEEMRAALRAGQSVVFFPEGTSTDGEAVLPFRSSLLEPAARLELPVRYAALRYATPPGAPPAREAVAWWGDMEFAPHLLDLLKLPGFEARIVFGEEPVRDADRKSLAARLHAAVAASFRPMLPAEDACLTTRTSPASS